MYNVCVRVCVCMCAFVCVRCTLTLYTWIYMYIHVYTNIYARACARTHTHTHTQRPSPQRQTPQQTIKKKNCGAWQARQTAQDRHLVSRRREKKHKYLLRRQRLVSLCGVGNGGTWVRNAHGRVLCWGRNLLLGARLRHNSVVSDAVHNAFHLTHHSFHWTHNSFQWIQNSATQYISVIINFI